MRCRGVVAFVAICIATACQPNRPGVETAPLDSNVPFVGFIMKTHGQIISVDEDVPRNIRRADVLLAPSTEIVARSGLLVSASHLRPGVRVVVWFSGVATQTDGGLVRATARKVQIDQ
jgi:hypothetical protein